MDRARNNSGRFLPEQRTGKSNAESPERKIKSHRNFHRKQIIFGAEKNQKIK